jgi:hypothetical protein
VPFLGSISVVFRISHRGWHRLTSAAATCELTHAVLIREGCT